MFFVLIASVQVSSQSAEYDDIDGGEVEQPDELCGKHRNPLVVAVVPGRLGII